MACPARLPIIGLFTNQVLVFRGFTPIGQAGGTSPVSSAEYTLSGPGMTELFITTGTLCGGGVSYILNPHSKRTN